MRTELDLAGIDTPELRAAYQHCRALHARYGRTYYLATRILPPWRRPAIHALYGFARWVDDVVDENGAAGRSPATVLAALDAELRSALAGDPPPPAGRPPRPVIRAVADTAARYHIDSAYFSAFMAAMRMDLTHTSYATLNELRRYMYGSAAVIGLQVLPVLGTVTPRERAAPHAAALGEAFQLTNFLRDVAEDLDRGRVYLPQDILATHGVDRALLLQCRRQGRNHPHVRAALADLVALTRDIYAQARPGIAMLSPVSRPCVATAYTLYQGILDEIERADYDVWRCRHAVPTRRRLRVALPALGRAVAARVSTRWTSAPS
ncbi:phytoene/squalene synthase family protein [Salinactinospora qingdaonensis]|uniref:Phytoene/squalene synthase family protein n=1 Tax=Salinactinospora qingdaonensis TaxID=702744 RepID=A0ABP7GI14_9ACTN